jgi:hypothetical protein
MSGPRKHHYVPVFYQKNFINSQGLLWVYDRRLRTYKLLHPRSVCCEKDLYTLKRKDGPWERRIESECLSYIDGAGSAAIRELLPGKPNQETCETLAYFIGVQINRLPSAGRAISALYATSFTEMTRLMTVNVGRMQSTIDRYTRKTGKTIDVSAESMVEAVRGDHLKVVVTEVPFLKAIFSQAEFMSKVIMQLNWQILVAPPESGFIICDNPVVVVPPSGIISVGFLVPGTVKYFPLTSRCCLRLGDRGVSFGYRKISKETLQIINYNIAANSERFIMGPDKAQLVSVVSRSGSTVEDSTPRFTVQAFAQNDDGSLQMFTVQPVRYFYGKGPQAP